MHYTVWHRAVARASTENASLLAVQEETGNYASAVLLLACLCLVASGVAFLFPVAQRRQPHIISVNRSTSASRKLQV